MKKNNKGFVLVETLVVTVFVAAVFSVIYINFYPLIGEYERREFYDDLDSKYGAYWMKVFAQRSNFNFTAVTSMINNPNYGYYLGSPNAFCGLLPDGSDDRSLCYTMSEYLHVNQIIITRYRLDGKDTLIPDNATVNFKKKVMDRNEIGENFHSYVDFLPDYIVPSLNSARYRVLVEFKRTVDSDSDSETYYTYANMEVVRYD